MSDQDLDFDLFPSRPAAPASAPAPRPIVVKTGPLSTNRSDAAVAEADNRRDRRPRRR